MIFKLYSYRKTSIISPINNFSWYLLCSYHVPGTLVATLHTSFLVFKTTFHGATGYLHFTDEDVETKITYWRLHRSIQLQSLHFRHLLNIKESSSGTSSQAMLTESTSQISPTCLCTLHWENTNIKANIQKVLLETSG